MQGYRLIEKHGTLCCLQMQRWLWMLNYLYRPTSSVLIFLWIHITFEFYLSHALAQNIPPWKMILNSNLSLGLLKMLYFMWNILRDNVFFNINADALCPGQLYIDQSECLTFSTFVWIKRLRASVAQVFYHWCLYMWRQILSEVK